jgi:sporulation protein YqfC
LDSRVNKVKENISEKLELPRDIVLDLPKITITGDNEIIIENHKGVILFEEKQVKVNSGVGLISISGSNFEILFMGGSTITLSGKFKSMIYEGND